MIWVTCAWQQGKPGGHMQAYGGWRGRQARGEQWAGKVRQPRASAGGTHACLHARQCVVKQPRQQLRPGPPTHLLHVGVEALLQLVGIAADHIAGCRQAGRQAGRRRGAPRDYTAKNVAQWASVNTASKSMLRHRVAGPAVAAAAATTTTAATTTSSSSPVAFSSSTLVCSDTRLPPTMNVSICTRGKGGAVPGAGKAERRMVDTTRRPHAHPCPDKPRQPCSSPPHCSHQRGPLLRRLTSPSSSSASSSSSSPSRLSLTMTSGLSCAAASRGGMTSCR